MPKYILSVCSLLLLGIHAMAQIGVSATVEKNNNCQGTDCVYDGPSILINEIMLQPYDGDGSMIGSSGGQGEWIELFNPDECRSIDISCYYLGNNTQDQGPNGSDFYGGGLRIPNGTIVPPLGYLLIRGPKAPSIPPERLIENGGRAIEFVPTYDDVCMESQLRLWFPNAGGWFAFYDRDGVPQDAISWAYPPDVFDKHPCIASSESCGEVSSLASYDEIPSSRKFHITYDIGQEDLSFRRFPDGAKWDYGNPSLPTYGYCNSACTDFQEITCTGTIRLNISGGTPPYQIVWDDNRGQVGELAKFLCEGTYCATITDAVGNSTTHCEEVFDNRPFYEFVGDSVFCKYHEVVQLADLVETTNADFTKFSGSAVASGETFDPSTLDPGDYEIRYYYQNTKQCPFRDTFVLSVLPGSDYQLFVIEDNLDKKQTAFCEENGPAVIKLTGFPSPSSTYKLRYATQSGNRIESYPRENLSPSNNLFTVQLKPGLHKLFPKILLRDQTQECFASPDTLLIEVLPTPTIDVEVLDPAICQGEQASISFALEENPNFSFTIEELNGKDDSIYQPTGDNSFEILLFPDSAGTSKYRLSGLKDGAQPQCSSDTTLEFEVEVVEASIASVQGSGAWCEGTPIEAFVNVSSNQTVNVVYSLNGKLDSIQGQAPGMMIKENLDPGQYQLRLVSVTDFSGAECEGSAFGTFNITVFDNPEGELFLSPDPSCEKEPVKITLNAVGRAPFEVDVTNDLGVTSTHSFSSNTFEFIDTARQGLAYTITQVRDNNLGSSSTGMTGNCFTDYNETKSIQINPLPTGQISVLEDTICGNEELSLTFNLLGQENFKVDYQLQNRLYNLTDIPAQHTINPTLTESITFVWIKDLTDGNGCKAEVKGDTLKIWVFPIASPNFTALNRSSCLPLISNFSVSEGDVPLQSSLYQAGTYRENRINGNRTFVFNSPGSYDLSAHLVTKDGCESSYNFPDYFRVFDYPIADFYANPEAISVDANKLFLHDLSTEDVVKWDWSFSHDTTLLGTSKLSNPVFQVFLPQEETVTVRLVVENENSCSDTLYRQFFVEPSVSFYLPNAFTINGDGLNEQFKPIFSSYELVEDYSFSIYNRWGELMIETKDPHASWDGMYQGSLVPTGMYVWKVQYKLYQDVNPRVLKGNLTVLH